MCLGTGLDGPSYLSLLESPLIAMLCWFRLAFPVNILPSQAMSIIWRHRERFCKFSLRSGKVFFCFCLQQWCLFVCLDCWLSAGQLKTPFLLMTASDHRYTKGFCCLLLLECLSSVCSTVHQEPWRSFGSSLAMSGRFSRSS